MHIMRRVEQILFKAWTNSDWRKDSNFPNKNNIKDSTYLLMNYSDEDVEKNPKSRLTTWN